MSGNITVEQWKERNKTMRYFFFVYIWTGTGQQGDGNMWFESETFPSNEILKAKAGVICAEKANIVITNWKEMTKEDYEAFAEIM